MGSRKCYTCRYLWGWEGVVFPACECLGVEIIAGDKDNPYK